MRVVSLAKFTTLHIGLIDWPLKSVQYSFKLLYLSKM